MLKAVILLLAVACAAAAPYEQPQYQAAQPVPHEQHRYEAAKPAPAPVYQSYEKSAPAPSYQPQYYPQPAPEPQPQIRIPNPQPIGPEPELLPLPFGPPLIPGPPPLPVPFVRPTMPLLPFWPINPLPVGLPPLYPLTSDNLLLFDSGFARAQMPIMPPRNVFLTPSFNMAPVGNPFFNPVISGPPPLLI